MTIQSIPLSKLVPSSANVRKTGAARGIEELAASIEAHGLLQNLQVRSASKGRFEVVAGGRRLAAMTILRRQRKLPKDFPVPCHVLDDEDASEISLAENVVRLAMHPADQFAAFQTLAAQGKGVEEIAARFGVTPSVVSQRLKLASVSPVLIDLYREEEMDLDQLMAFTVSDDHAAQERVWIEQCAYNRSPRAIRAALTAEQVETDDRRVRFVGLDAYLAAGGGMNRDLFQPEHEGYLTSPDLLDRLVAERLEVEAATVRDEGWAWVEIAIQRDHQAFSRFERVRPRREPLTEEAISQRGNLSAEYDALVAEHGEDPDSEIADRLDQLWEQMEAIEASSVSWREEDRMAAGAMISIDHDGDPLVERGLVRPDDARRMRKEAAGEDATPTKASGLSASLVEALTAERTAALRALMMDDQTVALASLCHALALPLFYSFGASDQTSVEVRLTSRDLVRSAGEIETGRAGLLIAERQEAWAAKLPVNPEELFGWLLGQDAGTVSGLLAFCAAQSIDAVQGKSDHANAPRLAHAAALTSALRLDMRDWWSPTKDRYLGRVSKAMMLEAVGEGVSPQAADNLANLKKEPLIDAAERKLSGTGWLPALLRQAEVPDDDAMAFVA